MTAELLLAYLLKTSGSLLGLDTSGVDQQEAFCLAENIYYESKGEDIRGQFAVASVTLNRVESPGFPDSVCDVVQFSAKHRTTKKTVCAFSWYCENNKKGKPIPVKNKDGTVNQRVVDQFQVASLVAITALSKHLTDNTHGATHFHNPFTSWPSWRHSMKRTMRVGNHDFYKE